MLTCIQATERCTYTTGIIDCRPRNGTRDGKRGYKRTNQVTRPDGNHLLTGIYFIAFGYKTDKI